MFCKLVVKNADDQMNGIELEAKVKRITYDLVAEKGYACSVDILIRLKYLSAKDHEDWRFGRVNYLEKVCEANLSKLSLINKTLKKIANEKKWIGRWYCYQKFGKGKRIKLRFSKSGDSAIEDAYATHYVDKNRINEIKEAKAKKAAASIIDDEAPAS